MARDKKIESSTNVELGIVHAVRGRVRLRLKRDLAPELLPRVAHHLRQQGGILRVQIKQTSNNLVVNFDPDVISIAQLTESLQPFGSIATSSRGIADLSGESQTITYNRLLTLFPALVGLGVARALQVSGWKSILTYILAAGVTREVIDQVTGESEELENVELSPAKLVSTTEIVAEEISSLLTAIETDYEIVHQIPGRIRLRVPRISRDFALRRGKADGNYARELKCLLEQDTRIIDVRLKTNSGSVVILYDPEAFPDSNREKIALNDSKENSLIQSVDESETSTVLDHQKTKNQSEKVKESDLNDTPPPGDETSSESISLTSEIETEISDTGEAEGESPTKIANEESEIEETSHEFTNADYWSDFKSSMLLAMLELMGNLQVQPAKI